MRLVHHLYKVEDIEVDSTMKFGALSIFQSSSGKTFVKALVGFRLFCFKQSRNHLQFCGLMLLCESTEYQKHLFQHRLQSELSNARKDKEFYLSKVEEAQRNERLLMKNASIHDDDEPPRVVSQEVIHLHGLTGMLCGIESPESLHCYLYLGTQ